MSDSEGSSKKIKVVDRRRFTEDGSPKDPIAEQAPPEPAPTGAKTEPPEKVEAPAHGGPAPTATSAQTKSNPTTSQDFVELVATLAQQAEMILVGTDELPAQPAHAKRLIDFLGALETKTQGNLSVEEQRLLSTIVFELRTMFVQANR